MLPAKKSGGPMSSESMNGDPLEELKQARRIIEQWQKHATNRQDQISFANAAKHLVLAEVHLKKVFDNSIDISRGST